MIHLDGGYTTKILKLIDSMRMFRVVKTAVIFFVAICVGASMGVIPTTLPDMELRTGGNTAEMSLIFTWMGLLRVIGATTIGTLFDCNVNGMLMLAICLPLYGGTLALAPSWPSLPAFEALVAVATAFDASISSGSMAIIQKMWKTSPTTMLSVVQTTNLMTILGMAIGPQIARPFLGREVRMVSSHVVVASNYSINATFPTQRPPGEEFRPVQAIYLILGALNVGMAVVCVSTCAFECVTSGNGPRACLEDQDVDDVQEIPGSSDTSATDGVDETSEKLKLEPCGLRGCVLLAIIILFAVVSGGYAVVLTGLVFTYVYEYLDWSVNAGTALVTIKDGMRFVSVGALTFLVSRWVSPTWQMMFNLVAMLLASALMSTALLVRDTVVVLTASGILIAGLGSYNMCSTIITVVDESVHVGDRVLITIYSSFGVGSLIFPPLSGVLLHYVGARSYPLLMLALSGVGFTLLIIYSVLSRLMSGNRTTA